MPYLGLSSSWLQAQDSSGVRFADRLEWTYYNLDRFSETGVSFERSCVEFDSLLARSGTRLHSCPLVENTRAGACTYDASMLSSLQAKNSEKQPKLQTTDTLFYFALGPTRAPLPALIWWLDLLNRESEDSRVTSDLVILGDECPRSNSTATATGTRADACLDATHDILVKLMQKFTTGEKCPHIIRCDRKLTESTVSHRQ